MDNITFNGISGKFEASKNSEAPVALILYSTLIDARASEKVCATLINLMRKYNFTFMTMNLSNHPDLACDNIEYLNEGSLALEYIQQQCPLVTEYYIIGHSFAAWVAMQLVMRRPEIIRFFLLSPMLNNINFSFLSPCPASGLIIHGEKDTLIPQKQVDLFYSEIIKKYDNDNVQYHVINNADHFFDAYLGKVRNIINTYMKNEVFFTNKKKNETINSDSNEEVN